MTQTPQITLMAFLEVLTRCYKRPKMLALNQASLSALTSGDWTQTLLHDEIGRGVGWSYHNLARYAPHLRGEYIWILDDDDLCTHLRLIEDLKSISQQNAPQVIFVRMDHGAPIGRLPDDAHWGQRPAWQHIGVSAFIVRRRVWQQHASIMLAGHYGSDFDFISAIWAARPRVYWHDVVAAQVQRISEGQPE